MCQINVDTIDNLCFEARPSFIKIDIEGFERQAIAGMAKTIQEYNPVIALSVYHKPLDLFDLAISILSLNSNYDLYLRHYTESIYETVMFFVPKTVN